MITRLCDSAVVCRRSIASVAICTAVWKPNVKSVAARSLSIVFGTPTTLIAVLVQPAGDAERVLAADRDQRVEAVRLHRCPHLVDAAVDLVRVRAGRSEDRPAAVQDPARALERQVDRLVLEHAGPAVAEADELVAVGVDALADDGADDRIEAGAVAAAGEHANSHGAEVRRERASGAVSCSHFGNQRSWRGRYQLRSPSSFIAAGSSTARTSVASSRMATARPTPICLNSIRLRRGEDREHRDHHHRRAGHDAGRGLDAVRDRVLGLHPAVDRLADAADDEHVVVHREAEQDHEQEQRQPGRDPADGLEVRAGPRGGRTGRPR